MITHILNSIFLFACGLNSPLGDLPNFEYGYLIYHDYSHAEVAKDEACWSFLYESRAAEGAILPASLRAAFSRYIEGVFLVREPRFLLDEEGKMSGVAGDGYLMAFCFDDIQLVLASAEKLGEIQTVVVASIAKDRSAGYQAYRWTVDDKPYYALRSPLDLLLVFDDRAAFRATVETLVMLNDTFSSSDDYQFLQGQQDVLGSFWKVSFSAWSRKRTEQLMQDQGREANSSLQRAKDRQPLYSIHAHEFESVEREIHRYVFADDDSFSRGLSRYRLLRLSNGGLGNDPSWSRYVTLAEQKTRTSTEGRTITLITEYDDALTKARNEYRAWAKERMKELGVESKPAPR